MLVKGRSNYISLRRLEAAVGAGRGDVPAGPRSSTSSPRSGSGRARRATAAAPTSTSARCRRSGTPSSARTATAWARKCPRLQGLLLLQGPAADVVGQHPGRQPRPVHERPGPARRRARASCPTTTWPSSTRPTRSRPSPASTSGCKVTSGQFEYTAEPALQRPDRQGAARLPPPRRRDRAGPAGPVRGARLLRGRRRLAGRARRGQRPAPQAAAAGPTRSARSCASWRRRSARGRGRSRPRSSGSS